MKLKTQPTQQTSQSTDPGRTQKIEWVRKWNNAVFMRDKVALKEANEMLIKLGVFSK